MSESFDLLGDPIPEGFGKRGRPPHLVTDEKRLKVRVLLAFTGDEEQVAAGMGISLPTLKKHYFRELREKISARQQLKATLLFRLMTEAEAGNATAIEKLFKRLDKLELTEIAAAVSERGQRKGKKEQIQEAADQVAGKFGVPSAPRLVN